MNYESILYSYTDELQNTYSVLTNHQPSVCWPGHGLNHNQIIGMIPPLYCHSVAVLLVLVTTFAFIKANKGRLDCERGVNFVGQAWVILGIFVWYLCSFQYNTILLYF